MQYQMKVGGRVSVMLVSLLLLLFLIDPDFHTEATGLDSRLEPTPPVYQYKTENSWIALKDGVKVSVTYFKPVPQSADEKFPVLFEFLPYRKDDPVVLKDDPDYAYFARRGYIVARVDIRGTGSSEGVFPIREYSEQELDDAVEIIGQLSRLPESNSKVGMWGISWGGFNAIQVAMRQPPALKAILAAHASDDLYHDDIHYIDGAFHVDPWATDFDHSKALPQTPDWQLDEAYFRDRLGAYPGILTYMKQQTDGDFWRKNSLSWQFDKLKVPTYLIGGLLDGYRDTVPRMLENVRAPIKGVMGPWNHDYPSYGVPGPNYEWRYEAVRWWDYWLKGRNTGVLDDPDLVLFIRDGHGPDAELKMTPGHWVCEDWPIEGTTWKSYFPGGNHQLENDPEEPAEEALRYVPSYGAATTGTTLPAEVNWWGDPKGDIRPDDAGSLVFDSPVLKESVMIAGYPRVRLRVSADAPLAHWAARVEDIQPDGTVSLVAGALVNGAQRFSRLSPEELLPGEIYDLSFDLHFTTWTYKPGHRIRLAVSNALFPMIWPTPYPMTTKLWVGVDKTCLELPVIPAKERKPPDYKKPEPLPQNQMRRDESIPATEKEASQTGIPEAYFWPPTYEQKRDLYQKVRVEWKESSGSVYEDRRVRRYLRNYFETDDKDPSRSRYIGESGTWMAFSQRTLDLRSVFDIHSDKTHFYVTITHHIYENGVLAGTKEWKESIPRVFQ